MTRGFLIVKFANANDKNSILGCGFSWEERFPLMAKPWYLTFNLMLTLSRTLHLQRGFWRLVGIGRMLLGRWRMVGNQLKEKKENPPFLHLIYLYVSQAC